MSLTLTTTADTVAPAYQPIIFKATPDTTVSRPNYTVRFSVIVDGETIAIYNTTLSNGVFTVDISSALQSVLGVDVPSTSDSEIISASNSITDYTVQAVEYWDVDNILTLQSGTVTSPTKWAIKAAYKKTAATEFLTDQTYIYKNGNMYLGLLTDETTGIYAMLNGTTTIHLTSGETINKLALIPITPKLIGTSESITVQVFDSTDTAISELLTLPVYTSCYPDEIMIKFLNKYGVMDCYTFLNRVMTLKALRGESLFGQVWSNHSVDIDSTLTLYGKYEANDTREWLAQLFSTRFAYNEDEAVRITSDNFESIGLDMWRPEIDVQEQDQYLN